MCKSIKKIQSTQQGNSSGHASWRGFLIKDQIFLGLQEISFKRELLILLYSLFVSKLYLYDYHFGKFLNYLFNIYQKIV